MEMKMIQRNKANKVAICPKGNALVASQAKDIMRVMMLVLTNVFKTIKDTSNKRGLPSNLAMS